MFKEHFSLIFSHNIKQNLFSGKTQTYENDISVSQLLFPVKTTADIAGTLLY